MSDESRSREPTTGPRVFAGTDLAGARFADADLRGAEFRESDLTGARMIGAIVQGVVIDGLVSDLVVNEVEVTGYVRDELDRRHPERPLLRSEDPDELRRGWAWLVEAWDGTVARIAALPPDDRDRRVDCEWSAIETLRHLVFVTDSWIRRAVLGVADPFDPIGLAGDALGHQAEMGLDATARPGLAQVVAVRARQRAELDELFATLTPERLMESGPAAESPGWPADPTSWTVAHCVHVLLEEEWAHRRFCERDLDRMSTD